VVYGRDRDTELSANADLIWMAFGDEEEADVMVVVVVVADESWEKEKGRGG